MWLVKVSLIFRGAQPQIACERTVYRAREENASCVSFSLSLSSSRAKRTRR